MRPLFSWPPRSKDKQKLPPREERAFKDVMVSFCMQYYASTCAVRMSTQLTHDQTKFVPQKLYESKSYKKCIKTCDTILKKFPNHGGI